MWFWRNHLMMMRSKKLKENHQKLKRNRTKSTRVKNAIRCLHRGSPYNDIKDRRNVNQDIKLQKMETWTRRRLRVNVARNNSTLWKNWNYIGKNTSGRSLSRITPTTLTKVRNCTFAAPVQPNSRTKMRQTDIRKVTGKFCSVPSVQKSFRRFSSWVVTLR